MDVRFDGRTVIVTGAAGGFGSAISRAFAESGARVIVADVNADGAERLARELPSAIAVTTDVTDPDAVRDLVQAAVDDSGRLDVLVNNAGLPHRNGDALELPVEVVDQQFAVNVRSVFLGCKYGVPAMRRTAGGGVVVNVASIAGKRPRPGMSIYNATKAAVINLTKGLATEFAPDVRVNAVNPVVSETGFIKNSHGVDRLPDDVRERFVRGIPMGRPALPQDIANSVVYLASDQAAFLTGTCLDVDGGRSIG